MHKYIVTVLRTEVVSRDIEVEASSEKEAKELAADKAGNYEFTRVGEAVYTVGSIKRL